jgi:hypothetical protein
MILDTAKFEVFQKNSYQIFIEEINGEKTNQYKVDFENFNQGIRCVFKNFARLLCDNINRGYTNEGFVIEIQFGKYIKDNTLSEEAFRENQLKYLQDFAQKIQKNIYFRANILNNGIPKIITRKITFDR